MFILKKTHEKIVNELQKELKESKDLKYVLTLLAEKTGIPKPVKGGGLSYLSVGACGVAWADAGVSFPDNVATYIDDYYGGKVIKQESIKVLVIDKDGDVTTHFTKQKPDDGFLYKIERLK